MNELENLVERVRSGEIGGVDLPTIDRLLAVNEAELHKTIMRDRVLPENFKRELTSEFQ